MDDDADPQTNTGPELSMTIRSSLLRAPLPRPLAPSPVTQGPWWCRALAQLVPKGHGGLLLAGLAACTPAEPARRAVAATGGVTVALASPIGYVKVGDRRIVWRSTPGIARYEVVLSDSVETPIFTAVTADTQVTVPADFRYSLSQNYRWYVTAYRDSDSTAWRSPVAIFRLEGAGRRMPPMPKP